MLADAVGRHAFVALGEMRRQFRRAARAGDAALLSMMMSVQVDEFLRHQRRQAKNAGLRIAAGIGDQLGGPDLVAVDFRQTVDRVREIGQIVMAFAVPLGIDVRIAQAIIGTEVDDAHAPLAAEPAIASMLTPCGKQPKTHSTPLASSRSASKGLHAQVDPARQARMRFADRRHLLIARGDRDDLGLRMAQQDLDQFAGRCSRCRRGWRFFVMAIIPTFSLTISISLYTNPTPSLYDCPAFLDHEPAGVEITMMQTIHEAAEAIQGRRVSPIDLVEQCFAAIEHWEKHVHAWVFVDAE